MLEYAEKLTLRPGAMVESDVAILETAERRIGADLDFGGNGSLAVGSPGGGIGGKAYVFEDPSLSGSFALASEVGGAGSVLEFGRHVALKRLLQFRIFRSRIKDDPFRLQFEYDRLQRC